MLLPDGIRNFLDFLTFLYSTFVSLSKVRDGYLLPVHGNFKTLK